MAVTAKPLINAKYAQNANTTEYTVPAGTKTIIDKFTATNVDSSDRTISVHIVPSGQTAADSYLLYEAKSLTAGVSYDLDILKNHVLNTGDFISVVVSANTAIVIRASGREVT